MEDIIGLIEKLGLPVAVCVALAYALWKLGGRMLTDHASVIAKKDEVIDKQNTVISNHIDHLTSAVVSLVAKLDKCETQLEAGADKIVTSIEHQSDMMREVLSRDCPLKK